MIQGSHVLDFRRFFAPLAGHGVFIADGDSPDRDDPIEHRTAVLCLTSDLSRATAVVRDGRGFRLRPFPEERALWEAEFLDLFGLSDRFAWAERAQHYIGGGVQLEDSTFSDALKGGGNAVRRWCSDRGIADSLQLERVSEMGNRFFSGLSAKEMLSTDLRQSVFPEDFGYGVPAPVAGQFRTKGTLIFPEVALVHFGASRRGRASTGSTTARASSSVATPVSTSSARGGAARQPAQLLRLPGGWK